MFFERSKHPVFLNAFFSWLYELSILSFCKHDQNVTFECSLKILNILYIWTFIFRILLKAI